MAHQVPQSDLRRLDARSAELGELTIGSNVEMFEAIWDIYHSSQIAICRMTKLESAEALQMPVLHQR
jgi:hypothetical protein